MAKLRPGRSHVDDWEREEQHSRVFVGYLVDVEDDAQLPLGALTRQARAVSVDISHLLHELCTKLGYCLDSADQESLIADSPGDAESFTDTVLRAEGFDPERVERRARREVLDLVTQHLAAP